MIWKRAKKVLIFIVALAFLALGIVGLFLPFLQGFLFLAVAFLLFSTLSPSIRVAMDTRTRKYPKIHRRVLKLDAWLRKVIGEV